MPDRPQQTLSEANERFYEQLWNHAYFVGPERFNTWPLVRELTADAPRRLEIGPGLRPRLPLAGTHFLDISAAAVAAIAAHGGQGRQGDAAELPYGDEAFDLVCALDIIEHVESEEAAFSEVTRVLRPGGMLLLAVPMNPEQWTRFDTTVGHARRYTRVDLLGILARHGLTIERSAPYGMQSNSRPLLNFTASGFFHWPHITMFLYNYIFLPLGLKLQKPLRLSAGLIDTTTIDEVLLVCRKSMETDP